MSFIIRIIFGILSGVGGDRVIFFKAHVDLPWAGSSS